jgi:uncharacterized membrane protein
MDSIIHSITGLIHLLSCLLALVAGTCILILSKGSVIHKRIGYVYSLSMIIVNGTAFGLYHLFGRFGPFHIAALISVATLVAGMVPVMFRTKSWLSLHLSFMYYSVIGLYAAFASEIIVRIPGIPFGPAVGMATALVMITANLLFRSLSIKWTNQFSNHQSIKNI